MKTFAQYFQEVRLAPQAEYRGGASEIADYFPKGIPSVPLKPLPGGSDFTWGITNEKYTNYIFIVDKDKIIGFLKLQPFGIDKHFQTSVVTVDANYQGQRLGLSLYGIALTLLKFTLVSDDIQTAGGRKMWVGMGSIAGVKIAAIIDRARIDEVVPAGGINIAQVKKQASSYPKDSDYMMFPVERVGETFVSPLIKVYDNKSAVQLVASYGR